MSLSSLFTNLRDYTIQTTDLQTANTIAPVQAIASFAEFEANLDTYAYLSFSESGMALKAILQKVYQVGEIDGFEDVKVKGDRITGIFYENLSPTLSKRFQFTASPDGIFYELVNADSLDKADFSEFGAFRYHIVEFEAEGKKRKSHNCKDGVSKPCTRQDGTVYCISKGFKCPVERETKSQKQARTVKPSTEDAATLKQIIDRGSVKQDAKVVKARLSKEKESALEAKITSAIASGATVEELQRKFKYPASKYGDAPETNPVNRIIGKMRDRGSVQVGEDGKVSSIDTSRSISENKDSRDETKRDMQTKLKPRTAAEQEADKYDRGITDDKTARAIAQETLDTFTKLGYKPTAEERENILSGDGRLFDQAYQSLQENTKSLRAAKVKEIRKQQSDLQGQIDDLAKQQSDLEKRISDTESRYLNRRRSNPEADLADGRSDSRKKMREGLRPLEAQVKDIQAQQDDLKQKRSQLEREAMDLGAETLERERASKSDRTSDVKAHELSSEQFTSMRKNALQKLKQIPLNSDEVVKRQDALKEKAISELKKLGVETYEGSQYSSQGFTYTPVALGVYVNRSALSKKPKAEEVVNRIQKENSDLLADASKQRESALTPLEKDIILPGKTHSGYVFDALSKGVSVPESVLSEYPEMAARFKGSEQSKGESDRSSSTSESAQKGDGFASAEQLAKMSPEVRKAHDFMVQNYFTDKEPDLDFTKLSSEDMVKKAVSKITSDARSIPSQGLDIVIKIPDSPFPVKAKLTLSSGVGRNSGRYYADIEYPKISKVYGNIEPTIQRTRVKYNTKPGEKSLEQLATSDKPKGWKDFQSGKSETKPESKADTTAKSKNTTPKTVTPKSTAQYTPNPNIEKPTYTNDRTPAEVAEYRKHLDKVARSLNPRKGEIELQMEVWNDAKTRRVKQVQKVDAIIFDNGLAYHTEKDDNGKVKQHIITHVNTGMAVAKSDKGSETEAKRFAAALKDAGLDMNWRSFGDMSEREKSVLQEFAQRQSGMKGKEKFPVPDSWKPTKSSEATPEVDDEKQPELSAEEKSKVISEREQAARKQREDREASDRYRQERETKAQTIQQKETKAKSLLKKEGLKLNKVGSQYYVSVEGRGMSGKIMDSIEDAVTHAIDMGWVSDAKNRKALDDFAKTN